MNASIGQVILLNTLITKIVFALLYALFGLLFIFLILSLLVWSVRRAAQEGNWSARWLGVGAVAGMASIWALAFSEPWAYVLLPTAGKIVLVVSGLALLLGASVVAARRLPNGLSALYDAFLIMGTPWSLTWGTYIAHKVGWHGLRFEDLGSREMGRSAVFLVPLALTIPLLVFGGLLGLFAGIGVEGKAVETTDATELPG